jgi:hypothetical protein
VEGGWSHAQTLQFQLQSNQTSAKLDVTTTDSQQYSTMLNLLTPQHVQYLGSDDVTQLIRVVGAPAVLFPSADDPFAGEGEASASVVWASNDAEGESTTEAYLATLTTSELLVNAGAGSARPLVTGPDISLHPADTGPTPPAEILMPATPADGYLATDRLMAEAASSTTDSLGIEPLLSDLQDDDYPEIVDGILAELSGESLLV